MSGFEGDGGRVRYFNFESEDEANINGDTLSELSDEFDEDRSSKAHSSRLSSNPSSTSGFSTLSLNDITYDRDLRFVNMPNNARQKALVDTGDGGRLFKQVKNITVENSVDMARLDAHYKKLDLKKRDADAKQNIPRTEASRGNHQSRRAQTFKENDVHGKQSRKEQARQSLPHPVSNFTQTTVLPQQQQHQQFEKLNFAGSDAQDRNFYQNRGAGLRQHEGGRHQQQQQKYQQHGRFAGRGGGRFSKHESRNIQQHQQQYAQRGPQFQYEDQFQQHQFLGEEQLYNYADGSSYNYLAEGEFYHGQEAGYDDYAQQYSDRYQTPDLLAHSEVEAPFLDPPQQEAFGDNSTPSPAGGVGNLNPTAQEFVPSFMLR